MSKINKFKVPKRTKHKGGGFDPKAFEKKLEMIVQNQHLPTEITAELLFDLMKEYKHKFI